MGKLFRARSPSTERQSNRIDNASLNLQANAHSNHCTGILGLERPAF